MVVFGGQISRRITTRSFMTTVGVVCITIVLYLLSITHLHLILIIILDFIQQNVTENYRSFVPNMLSKLSQSHQIQSVSEDDNYLGLIPTSSLSNSLSAM